MSNVNDQMYAAELNVDVGFRPWQEAQINHLMSAYQANTLPHALMLSGPLGVSKKHFAEQLAFLLLCASPTSGQACGHCKSCALCLAGNHPDWANIGPEASHKAIRVDTIRSMQQRLQQTAQQGGNKICIICPAENMNENAANALLKVLEEPPADTYFLLVVHQVSQILPTILSRSQRVNFALPSANLVHEWLSHDFDEADIQSAIERARGFPERVKSILLTTDALQFDNETVAELIVGKRSAYDFAAKMDLGGAVSFLDALLTLLTQQSSTSLAKSSDDLPIMQVMTEHQRHKIYKLALSAKQALAQNANLRLLMEVFLQDCTTIMVSPHD